jgi:hypothetical protein
MKPDSLRAIAKESVSEVWSTIAKLRTALFLAADYIEEKQKENEQLREVRET